MIILVMAASFRTSNTLVICISKTDINLIFKVTMSDQSTNPYMVPWGKAQAGGPVAFL